jgi:hypothetical protein
MIRRPPGEWIDVLVVRTTEDPTDPTIGELVSANQTAGFDHFALAVRTHLGSMVFGHGLCLGRRQLTILTPASLPRSF